MDFKAEANLIARMVLWNVKFERIIGSEDGILVLAMVPKSRVRSCACHLKKRLGLLQGSRVLCTHKSDCFRLKISYYSRQSTAFIFCVNPSRVFGFSSVALLMENNEHEYPSSGINVNLYMPIFWQKIGTIMVRNFCNWNSSGSDSL